LQKRNTILTSFSPVVTSTALAENKVVGAEEGTKRSRSDGIHGSRLEVNQDSSRNVFVGTDLVVVDGDTFELKVVGSLVNTIMSDAVLVRHDFPEFGTYKKRVKSQQRAEETICVGYAPIWLPH